jgi:hypothetical protein
MIITIALGVMLGLFLTGMVARVLSDEGCVTGLAWTVMITAAVIVVLQLPPHAIGIAVIGVACLIPVYFVIALTRAVQRNGGRWVKGEPLVELQRELE